jgi:hypothetical protein
MTSFQVAQWLRQGIAAAQAGDVNKAYDLLLKVVDVDEYNEQAWLWLSSVVETDADREVCLDNVLAINPENKLAKAGLVHLRSKKAQPALPLEPETAPSHRPQSGPLPSVADTGLDALASDWWDQPEAGAPVAEGEIALDERLATTGTLADEETEDAPAEPKPERKRRPVQAPTGWLAITVLLLMGVLAAGAAIVAVKQSGIFDPVKREYVSEMRQLLTDYEAWWEGPQGTLVNELNRLCGPATDGWRNRDVLQTCSSHPSVDCDLLGAHCGTDIEAMRTEVRALSREVQKSGEILYSAIEVVTPPDDVAQAHTRFLACIQSRLDGAARINELARGASLTDPDQLSACRVFSSAEMEIRAYIGSP